MDIYLAVPQEPGWVPVIEMAKLLALYTGGNIIEVEVQESLSKKTKVLSQLPRRKGSGKKALVIAYDPGQLYAIQQAKFFTKNYSYIAGWVFDSFWSDRIPKFVLKNKVYDYLFVTDLADEQDFRNQGIKNVTTLPWGTDVLSNFHTVINADKKTDVLRVGRQPDAWSDDQNTLKHAESLSLKFAGRPGFGKTIEESNAFLKTALLDAKVVLAFSNRVSPTDYTHPSKEYITGRWVDALGMGCVVAGVAPQSAAATQLLWDGATIEVPVASCEEGLKKISEYEISPETVRNNMCIALQKLDWRHRFSEIFTILGIESAQLQNDLRKIEELSSK